MRATVHVGLLAVALVACGKSKPANEPENTVEATSVDGGEPGPLASSSEAPAPDGPVVPGDDPAAKKPSPCAGFDIPDLLSVISQAACEVPGATTNASPREMKDVLEITVAPDSPRIAPGGSAAVTITFKNKGKTPLPLDFVVDPEPRFDFQVYTLKGDRADAPRAPQPTLPSDVVNAAVAEPKIARVVLAQLGTARMALKWQAVRYKWASKDRAKGALPGRGYPKEPAGPLPKGAYVLRVITPLTGVFEGIDHEVSQPRVQVTVAPMP
jgi:hypothetical protein